MVLRMSFEDLGEKCGTPKEQRGLKNHYQRRRSRPMDFAAIGRCYRPTLVTGSAESLIGCRIAPLPAESRAASAPTSSC